MGSGLITATSGLFKNIRLVDQSLKNDKIPSCT